jgi:two-component system sensor histidine kinase GlrK
LLELEEQKTNFLRHVSHELKTPLTAIREGSELLKDEVPGPLTPDQADVAKILRDNSLRLQRLIEDLLSYSMAPPAVSRIDAKAVDLAAVIRRVTAGQEIAGRAKGLRLDLVLEPVTLLGDEEKFQSILDNLLSNAIKYSPKNGTIVLSLSRTNDDAIIDVVDEGPGVPSAERERVFEAFYQGSAPYLGHVKGTGLGLALARDYVRAHNGTIGILDSRRGARFRIRLPMRNSEVS